MGKTNLLEKNIKSINWYIDKWRTICILFEYDYKSRWGNSAVTNTDLDIESENPTIAAIQGKIDGHWSRQVINLLCQQTIVFKHLDRCGRSLRSRNCFTFCCELEIKAVIVAVKKNQQQNLQTHPRNAAVIRSVF